MGSINRNNNNVILVSDIDCIVALVYELKYQPKDLLLGDGGKLWTTFNYDATLQEWIDIYESGNFKVTLPGYVDFYEDYTKAYYEFAASRFDVPVLTDGS